MTHTVFLDMNETNINSSSVCEKKNTQDLNEKKNVKTKGKANKSRKKSKTKQKEK